MKPGGLIAGLLLLCASPAADAGEVSVAVAANFTEVAERLAVDFKRETGDDLVLSFGASGALYAQITQGAPFEVFLSADAARPKKAVEDGLGLVGTTFTYAVGKLSLYAPGIDVSAGEQVLQAGGFDHLAIADPVAAPYGAAAVEVLMALGVYDAVAPRLVTGQNIVHTLQFVESGNAELGFVALSQVMAKDAASVWLVPENLYSPILQDAVLLRTGEDNPVARAFLDYLRGDEAAAIIRSAGYEVD